MFFHPKKTLAVAAALLLTGGTASAAAVITGWNLDNVAVSTTAPNVEGTSTLYDRSAADAAAKVTGRVTFDGDEANSPGVKIINDDALTGSNGSNCIMANSASSCNAARKSGKRFKFQTTGSAPTDMVFNVNPNGSFTTAGNDGFTRFSRPLATTPGPSWMAFR
jgi:hypothetical protein